MEYQLSIIACDHRTISNTFLTIVSINLYSKAVQYSLMQILSEAKSHINRAHTLYHPHPDDQLVINTVAAQSSPGIGHTVYAISVKELVLVQLHSINQSFAAVNHPYKQFDADVICRERH